MKYTKKQLHAELLQMIDATEAAEGQTPVQYLFERFKDEYCFPNNMKRFPNHQERFKQWIQGLPSALNIPFSNYDILQFAIKTGSLSANATDKEENKILANYFNYMAANYIQMASKEKIDYYSGQPEYILSQNGVEKFRGTENECYFKLQRLQGQSADWAIKYEGWKVAKAI